ncbi:MAG: DUF433 domain-containing protein [Planctomycetaceae bacterium]|jgi:uncharacterized protein (DUF433 family)|nr:DUF433 domain-containing protein [Planctomycetaceae bacterium]
MSVLPASPLHNSRLAVPVIADTLLSRITVNPAVCGGKPCIKGHRIWVTLILDLLAAGTSIDEILENYPSIERDDVLACIAYGAEKTRFVLVDLELDDAV